jgi:DNA-binding IclR family transcriptional regulator
VARVLDILETLSGRPAGASLTELSVSLEAPKTSLLPLLRTLVSRGYAARGDSGRYGIGPR